MIPSGKLPLCDLVHLNLLCAAPQLYEENKRCAFYVYFFCLCHVRDVSSNLMYHVSRKTTVWIRLALGKIRLLACRQDFYLLLDHIA